MKMSSKIKVENQIANMDVSRNKASRSLEYSLDNQNTFDDSLKKVPLKSVLPLNIYDNNLPGM